KPGQLRQEGPAREGTGERADAGDPSYRLLFDRSPQPLWVCDRGALIVLAANEAALRHYGYARAEFLALTAHDLFPAGRLPDFFRPGCPAAAAAPGPAAVWPQRRKDGTLVEMEIRGSSVRFQGQDAFLVVAHDVTGRRRA